MINRVRENFGLTIKQLIISFFFAGFFMILVLLLFGKSLKWVSKTVTDSNILDVREFSKNEDLKISSVIERKLSNYPSYGSVFASIEIPTVRINLDVYHGEDLDILKHGAGHFESSYFPGEGGTVLITAHNNSGFFKHLPEVKKNDEIVIKASYGTYRYKVDSTNIVDVSKLNKIIKISDKKESLILYTCYPIGTPGLKRDRFVVYASLVGE